MILSFGWTRQFLPPQGTKDTTRRVWKPRALASWQRAWDNDPQKLHTAVDKCLAYGGQRIGHIQLIERPYQEQLSQMPESDLIREGGMSSTVDEFIDRYFKGDGNQLVTVVRFKFFEDTTHD